MEIKKLDVHNNSELTLFMEQEHIAPTYANYKFIRQHYEAIYETVMNSEVPEEPTVELSSRIETLTEENLSELFFRRRRAARAAAAGQPVAAPAKAAVPAQPVPTVSGNAGKYSGLVNTTGQVSATNGAGQQSVQSTNMGMNNTYKAGNFNGNSGVISNTGTISGGMMNNSGAAGSVNVGNNTTSQSQTTTNMTAGGNIGGPVPPVPPVPPMPQMQPSQPAPEAPAPQPEAPKADAAAQEKPAEEAKAEEAPKAEDKKVEEKKPEEAKKGEAKKEDPLKADPKAFDTKGFEQTVADIKKSEEKANEVTKKFSEEERKAKAKEVADKIMKDAKKEADKIEGKEPEKKPAAPKAEVQKKAPAKKVEEKPAAPKAPEAKPAPAKKAPEVKPVAKPAPEKKAPEAPKAPAAKPAAPKAAPKGPKELKEELVGLSMEEACNVLVRESVSHKEIISIITESYSDAIGDSISAFTKFTTHIENTIKICEEVKAKEEKAAKEAAEKKPTQAPEEMAFGKQLAVAADGSLSVSAPGTLISVAPDKSLQISLAENRHSNRVLKYYLTEDCGMSLTEFVNLTEETKVASLKEILSDLLKTIEEKLSGIDTSAADRSRGDVRKLAELNSLQDAITKIEAMIERDYNSLPQYASYIGTIIKSILYLNQYSATFKDAYRNKKTVLIMKYQSVVLSVISALSYFLSVAVDYNDRGNIKLRKALDVNIMEFAPLKALETFVKSVETGEFKMLVGDTNTLREFYLEHSVDTMSSILEASDYIPMIIDGVKNLYSALTSNGKIVEVLYKAAGVAVLLLSLRDVFYTLFKTKTKVADMLNNIDIFANLNNGGNSLGKLSQFASKFASDAEFGSEVAKREMEDENKKVYSKVQNIQAVKPEATLDADDSARIVKTSSWDEFDF